MLIQYMHLIYNIYTTLAVSFSHLMRIKYLCCVHTKATQVERWAGEETSDGNIMGDAEALPLAR